MRPPNPTTQTCRLKSKQTNACWKPKKRSLLKQFLAQAERTAANYKPALELLSVCQSMIKAVTPAAKELEELQKFKNKRAGKTFLIYLAACYTKLVNTQS